MKNIILNQNFLSLTSAFLGASATLEFQNSIKSNYSVTEMIPTPRKSKFKKIKTPTLVVDSTTQEKFEI